MQKGVPAQTVPATLPALSKEEIMPQTPSVQQGPVTEAHAAGYLPGRTTLLAHMVLEATLHTVCNNSAPRTTSSCQMARWPLYS